MARDPSPPAAVGRGSGEASGPSALKRGPKGYAAVAVMLVAKIYSPIRDSTGTRTRRRIRWRMDFRRKPMALAPESEWNGCVMDLLLEEIRNPPGPWRLAGRA